MTSRSEHPSSAADTDGAEEAPTTSPSTRAETFGTLLLVATPFLLFLAFLLGDRLIR